MYQRRYPPSESLPPNYKGNAFDSAPSKEAPPPAEKTAEEASLPLSSLFSRRDGSSFALDDIILGALIILLLNSHADDELLLILLLLFISGI